MVKTQTTKNTTEFKSAPVRLWVKSKFLSFKRNRKNQTPNQAILRIENVNTPQDSQYYMGKRVVYIYKAHNKEQGTKFRTIWGKICKPHGNQGAVIARFSPNLPARAMGATLRVQLYPQTN